MQAKRLWNVLMMMIHVMKSLKTIKLKGSCVMVSEHFTAKKA